MHMLEIEYIYYICQMSLSVNSQLLKLYNQYTDPDMHECSDLRFSDNELDSFLIEIIDSAEYWIDIENAKRIDALIANYYRLADLIRYMHRIEYLMQQHSLMYEEIYSHNHKLSDYQLEDSMLVSFVIDSSQNSCHITLENVLCYNDKRIDKSNPVNSCTLVIKFLNTKKIDMNGQLNIAVPYANAVYKWYRMETESDLYDFSLLVLVGHRQFLLQILHSDIEVQQLAYEMNRIDS